MPWESVPAIHVPAGFPDNYAEQTLQFGSLHRFDLSGAGAGDIFGAMLPLVTSADVSKRVGFAEVTGTTFGPGLAEIQIDNAHGQTIDQQSLPIAPTGPFPRFVFVACQISSGPDVYGWTIESQS
jgi:hypothetical protein